MTTRTTLIAAMLAAGAIVGQASADVVGVSRCDEAVNGVYRPGLLTLESDGTRTFHPVGENGLTETITFNGTLAFEWVAAQGLYPAGTTFTDYDNFICGLPCEECEEEDSPEPDLPDNGDDATHGTDG
jgi:hypothetical protein